MLITFKSPTGSDVSMFENNAKVLIGILGKSPDDLQGAVTAEQLPSATSSAPAINQIKYLCSVFTRNLPLTAKAPISSATS